MKAIGLHSFKGGAGKTFIALNLSYILSKVNRVCLVDFDLRAPSLYTFFKGNEYINHLLAKRDDPEKYLVRIFDNLSVILASPDLNEIKRDIQKNEKEEMRLLEGLLDLKSFLEKKFDYVVFDTSPGLSYRSINSMLISDIILFVCRPEKIDLEGLRKLAKVTENLKVPKFVILNRVQKNVKVNSPLKVISKIPCSCDISMDKPFYVKDNPETPITKSIEELARFFEESE